MTMITINTLQAQLTAYYQDQLFAQRIFNFLFKNIFGYLPYLFVDNQKDNNKMMQLKKNIDSITKDDTPYQYILGSVEFGRANIVIRRPILIPRNETEYMVEMVTTILSSQKNESFQIVDFCAGSGCIGIALLLELQKSFCTAFEINHDGVALAAENASHNQVRNRYKIYKKDILKLKKIKNYDIIISNPPYISWNLYEKLDNSVKKWEDSIALTDNNDGCKIIFFLLTIGVKKKKDSIIVIEICHTNAGKILHFAKTIFLNSFACIIKDQYKKPRILLILNGKHKSLRQEIIKNYELFE